jgi:hypothetical protein
MTDRQNSEMSISPPLKTMRKLLLLIILSIMSAVGPPLSSCEEDIKYGVGNWDPESGLGNHRAVVRVEAPRVSSIAPGAGREAAAFGKSGPAVQRPAAARVIIPWRRRDADPEKKDIIVVDAATGARIANVLAITVAREFGDLIFETPTMPGDYFIYYMPYKSEGRKNYPNVRYDPPRPTADSSWLASLGLKKGAITKADLARISLAKAKVSEIQSADAFSSFYPMEVIAAAAETEELLKEHPDAPYLLFPEDRRFSIRLSDDLPRRWILRGPGRELKGEASPGEYFAYQIGIWAARRPIKNLEVRFSDLVLGGGPAEASSRTSRPALKASAMSCLNTGGSNWDGSRFAKLVPVDQGKIQALWCGIQVPPDAPPGVYRGPVTVAPEGLPPSTVNIELRIDGPALPDRGDTDPFRMTRLRWLDSRIALDDGLVPPYTPIKLEGRTVSCLGRSLEVGPDGLPARIRSRFASEMTRLADRAVDLTAAPFRLRLLDGSGRDLAWVADGRRPRFTKETAGVVAWEAENRAGGVLMTLRARLEFAGFADFKVALTAAADTDVSDIRLEIPLKPDCARYMMGLGFKGGERPETFDWSWDRKKNQDALWIGAVNAGLQVSLRAENYSRPLTTNFYLSKPLNMPPSWWNEGKGGVSIRALHSSEAKARRAPAASSRPGGAGAAAAVRPPSVVLVTARSGPRTLRAGETLHFDFTLLLTPFKPLDTAEHFRNRYFHAYRPLDEVAAAGANVINVHHATEINPYINYPFLRPREMKAYIDEAHRRGFKVKIYDTIRELSNRAAELFALRSLGHEIFSPGPGGGYSWLQEHLGGDYIAAWFVPELKDAAIINSGMSRWHNYYVEGLDWLARNVGIDGLYLDDVAFDRTTMLRVRKVLDRNRPGALIDLHSANQYNPRDGYASSANLYLEHLPFLNRLWFGEYFDYNGSGPDYWLVEMSGIPFGLMGEMLQDGGNPWRGMVFGMTSRLPWAGDPRPLWKVWDEFGIAGSEMIGWWVDANPVKTGRRDVLATVYLKKGKGAGARALIALASWADEPVEVRPAFDWKALGLDPKRAVLRAPSIDKFQPAASFKPGEALRVEPGKGWLLLVGD